MASGTAPTDLIRVVIADDQAEVRRALKTILERDGRFEVVSEASEGAQAIEAVKAAQPHALILDLAMPNVDGLRAIPVIRSASPDTKIVVLSSMVDFQDAGTLAETQGADAVFDKHVAPDELKTAIVELVTG